MRLGDSTVQLRRYTLLAGFPFTATAMAIGDAGSATISAMVPESRHLSIRIERPPGEVYDYAANPVNLPNWAAGMARTTVTWVDGQWVTDSPMGRVTVTFAERNDFGVLDHVVTLPSGNSVHNPYA